MIYRDISICEIELLNDLWNASGLYHSDISAYFTKDFITLNCEERNSFLNHVDQKKIKITVVELDKWELEEEKRIPPVKVVGYCVSTISRDKGEVSSLYLTEDYRRKGIGKRLINQHIEWFMKHHCMYVYFNFPTGDVDAMSFYKAIGYHAQHFQIRKYRH